MTAKARIRSVLVTGAGGNLGGKLVAHLLAGGWCERIVALDQGADAPPARAATPTAGPWSCSGRTASWRDA